MKTELRLGSVVPDGVGGPEAGSMDLIYSFLLSEFGQDIYRYIGINQIGNELDEFVMKEANKVYVNIRYPVFKDFKEKNADEKNRIRLDVVHTALMRIAENDNKFSVKKLEAIKNKILKNNFSFDFVYKAHINKKRTNQIAKVIIKPEMSQFKFYVVVEESGKEKCRLLIFTGKPTFFYSEKYFCYGKWKSNNEFVVWGKEKTVETLITVDTCKMDIINLTPYPNPPYYTLMKFGITAEEREQANKDWDHSMPPAHAAIVRQAHN